MRAKVIGAGLAGCEAAWAMAGRGVEVELYEMKPAQFSPAHRYAGFAELVCSNSLKAQRTASAAGLLKAEMRLLGSLTLRCAEQCAVPAGGALAVDRERFSDLVTEAIRTHPRIHVHTERVDRFDPSEPTVVATGPLTEPSLAEFLRAGLVGPCLAFYDAAAPIVSLDSVDRERVFFAARYGRGDDD